MSSDAIIVRVYQSFFGSFIQSKYVKRLLLRVRVRDEDFDTLIRFDIQFLLIIKNISYNCSFMSETNINIIYF